MQAQRPPQCQQRRCLRSQHTAKLALSRVAKLKVASRCTHLKATATSAVSSTEGLVFPKGAPGSWDAGAVGCPVVRCFISDNEERWYMWYSGRKDAQSPVDVLAPSAGNMGVAVSSDGTNWRRGTQNIEGIRGQGAAQDVGAALLTSEDWWCFDTCHVSVSDVQILSNSSVQSGVGVYWCFYSGGDFQPAQVPAGLPGADSKAAGQTVEGLRMRPGLAMSQDARNWARIEGDHHSGALFDVGGPGEWDELFIGNPQVISLAPRDMRMYYHSWDQQRKRFVIGCAVSPDGFRWTKKGVVFDPQSLGAGPDDHDAAGAMACSVVRDIDNRQYLMFYEAVANDGTRSIGLAVSKNGSTWKRCPVPVLTPAKHCKQGPASEAQNQASATSQQPVESSSQGSSDSNSSNNDSSSSTSAAQRETGSDKKEVVDSGTVWDFGGVGSPSAVSMSAGKWRLYYGGRPGDSGAWEGIGLALSVADGPKFENVPIRYERFQKKPSGL